MDNWEYFKVGYKEKPEAMGIVVRVDGKSKLEVFSGEKNSLKEFGLTYSRGSLTYDSSKYFEKGISESTARKHKAGREEWIGLQAFTRGASPAGLYSVTPTSVRRLEGF